MVSSREPICPDDNSRHREKIDESPGFPVADLF